MKPTEKINKLRAFMKKQHIDAYIVPSADPHQSEYAADHWQARAWLSGFAGSAGTVVVTQEKAGLWTDRRYHIRASMELQGSGIDLFKFGLPDTPSYIDWIQNELKQGGTVGFDGNVVSVAEVEEFKEAFAGRQIVLEYKCDLIGQIWQDRPSIPMNPIYEYEIEFAGESRISKLQRIRRQLKAKDIQVHVLTLLDDIAWTFNIRGRDVAYNPVAVSYAIITEQEARIFICHEKVPVAVQAVLERDGISFSAYEDIFPFIKQLNPGTKVLFDAENISYLLGEAMLKNYLTKKGNSIPQAMKAIKNETEMEGVRNAHIRDGVAMVKWMYWLDQHVAEGNHTEITVADKLTDFRRLGEYYQGLSFNNISGYQANSAIGHYSSDPNTTPTLKPDGILLLDSGAQYLDGTTDITRTLTLGSPSPEEKRAFTLVLKCQIRLATTKFPQGTKGNQLDMIAREPLWREGWNCRHGIGHGVGHFLNVHEGPQGFSGNNAVAFEPGMITSNEPGVYFEGEFGVRIENVLLTVAGEMTEFGAFYCFETVTICPIDLDLVQPSMLSTEEKMWLNEYHRIVYQKLAPFLADEERTWLKHETREI